METAFQQPESPPERGNTELEAAPAESQQRSKQLAVGSTSSGHQSLQQEARSGSKVCTCMHSTHNSGNPSSKSCLSAGLPECKDTLKG